MMNGEGKELCEWWYPFYRNIGLPIKKQEQYAQDSFRIELNVCWPKIGLK